MSPIVTLSCLFLASFFFASSLWTQYYSTEAATDSWVLSGTLYNFWVTESLCVEGYALDQSVGPQFPTTEVPNYALELPSLRHPDTHLGFQWRRMAAHQLSMDIHTIDQGYTDTRIESGEVLAGELEAKLQKTMQGIRISL